MSTLEVPRLAAAGIGRRLLSLAYDTLLTCAVVLIAALLFVSVAGDISSRWSRALFQIYLVLVCGGYFVCCWRKGGQTLPMKTWRLRLVRANGVGVSWRQALIRYLALTAVMGISGISVAWGFLHSKPLAAIAGLAFAGVTYGWALLDRDRQFLHDRLLGTRIVDCR